MAKQQKPERWSRHTRDWTLPESITLNPDRKANLKSRDKQAHILMAA